MNALILLASAAEPTFDSPEGYSFGSQVVGMLFALSFVVGLVIAAAWLLKRLTSGKIRFGNHAHKIQIVERRPLSQKSSLYLIEVEGRRLVISDSPSGARTLCELGEKGEKPPLAEVIDRKLKEHV